MLISANLQELFCAYALERDVLCLYSNESSREVPYMRTAKLLTIRRETLVYIPS
jgi:hypothetical protein